MMTSQRGEVRRSFSLKLTVCKALVWAWKNVSNSKPLKLDILVHFDTMPVSFLLFPKEFDIMTAIHPSITIGRMVAGSPRLSRVFEEFKIDYCCGGKRPLEEVCREKQIDVDHLIERLSQAESLPAEPADQDWSSASLAELCDHVENTHHAYLRRELPRLAAIIAKVVHAHGANHPELAGVQSAFSELRAELEPHMMKEERVLFPAIRHLEAHGMAMPFPFGSLSNPVRVMCSEHDHAGDALERLRQLTGDYLSPWGACNTYHVMLEGLESLERDMHQHVHKENNILFPRALELESRLGVASETPVECGCPA